MRASFMLVTLVVACRSPESWKQYGSPRGGFQVLLPVAPVTEIDSSVHRAQDEEADGTVRDGAPFVAEEMVADRGEDGVYTVRWYEVTLMSRELTEREFLERLVATRRLGAFVPRWIHLGPYQGIEYQRIEPSMNVRSRSRMFVVEGRVFHMLADNWIKRDDEAAARRFLESFRLELRPELTVSYDRTVVGRRR
jgi:hypothetical protein